MVKMNKSEAKSQGSFRSEWEEWVRDFETAARWPLARRIDNAYIRTHKPVLDDAFFRSFDSTDSYRLWCETALPPWLGYGRSL